MASEGKTKGRKAAVPKSAPRTAKAKGNPATKESIPENETIAKQSDDTDTKDLPAKRPRKRTAEVVDDDAGEDSETAGPSTKSAKPKKNTKSAADEDIKPSKVDGHPVVIEKTAPGGDSVEGELSDNIDSKKTQRNRRSAPKRSTAGAEDHDASATKESKSTKAKGKVPDEPTVEKTAKKPVKKATKATTAENLAGPSVALELPDEVTIEAVLEVPVEITIEKNAKKPVRKSAKASAAKTITGPSVVPEIAGELTTEKTAKKPVQKSTKAAVTEKATTTENLPGPSAVPELPDEVTIEKSAKKPVRKPAKASAAETIQGPSAVPEIGGEITTDKRAKKPAQKLTKAATTEKAADIGNLPASSALPQIPGRPNYAKIMEQALADSSAKVDSSEIGVQRGNETSTKLGEYPIEQGLDIPAQEKIASDAAVTIGTSRSRKPTKTLGSHETDDDLKESIKTNITSKSGLKGSGTFDAVGDTAIVHEGPYIHQTTSKSNVRPSRKRKVAEGISSDSIKRNLLDPLAESASAAKKSKKSKPNIAATLGNTASNLISSGLQAVTHGADVAKTFVSDIGGATEDSIMGNVEEMASAAVSANETNNKAKTKQIRKGNGKARDNDDKAITAGESEESKAALSPNSDELGGNSENEEEDEDEEIEEDDQTHALLKGFESDGDEEESGDEGFKSGLAIPQLPGKRGLAKKLKDASNNSDEPGVVYIGRIPHGFHEHEMRSYFSQFGTVNHVRLSRSKKTGNSKHYAFLEFSSSDVAKIVASTMNNYLMFGHILKCSVISNEQVHPNLWKGADKRFKKVPWSSIEGRKLALPKSREQWETKVEKEKKRRSDKQDQLKEKMGYEFEGTLKGVDTIPTGDTVKAIEDGNGEEAIIEQERTVVVDNTTAERTLLISEEVKTVKVKKAAKGKKIAPEAESGELAEKPKTAQKKRVMDAELMGDDEEVEQKPVGVKRTRKSKKTA